MELDDQLAALAAGELDDDTARALRARAAADPALARRLARHERLQELLTTWDAPRPSAEAVARIDAALDQALADLGDGPLVERAAPTGPPAAVPMRASTDETAAGTPGPEVVDLDAARTRREQRRGLPAWLSGTAVAAALLAVVGVGVIAGGGTGGDDSDVMADGGTEESADTGMAESLDAGDEAMDEDATAEEAAPLAPTTPDDVVLAEGELLALLDASARAGATAQDGADDAAGADDTAEDATVTTEPDACVVEALERDTADVEGREVTFLAAGTYAGAPAQFVVVRAPQDGAGDRFEVLAYDPTDCTLLDRADEVR